MFEARELWDQMMIEAEENGQDILHVCSESGASPSTIAKWKSGRAYPNAYWMKKLRETLLSLTAESNRRGQFG